MKSTKKLLGERIKEIRKARRLTQSKLAELVDIEQKHVSRIESAKNYPSIDLLEELAVALNVPLMSFFDFTHLENDEVRTASIEEMLKELDEETRKLAYKLIRATIKTLKGD
ncbi:MAG: helix-turn-helix transcriptional regulator [Desulfuromonadales bacterium]|nr:helix-turn-helix transcriptional regulator [Desulfuromonadales bacterium]